MPDSEPNVSRQSSDGDVPETYVAKQRDVVEQLEAAGNFDKREHPVSKDDDGSKSMDVSEVVDDKAQDAASTQSEVCSRAGSSENHAVSEDINRRATDDNTRQRDATRDRSSSRGDDRQQARRREHDPRYYRDSRYGDYGNYDDRNRYDDRRYYHGSREHYRGYDEEYYEQDRYRDSSSHHHRHHHHRDDRDHGGYSRDRSSRHHDYRNSRYDDSYYDDGYRGYQRR